MTEGSREPSLSLDLKSDRRDHVEYRLPLGFLGDAVAHAFVQKKIEGMFAWRHKVTARELSGNIGLNE